MSELQPLGQFNRVIMKAYFEKMNWEYLMDGLQGNLSQLTWEGYLLTATCIYSCGRHTYCVS